jgi:hypothetical protein
MRSRRGFLSQSTGALLALAGEAFGARLLGQEAAPDDRDIQNLLTPDAQRAIDQGLTYLSREQQDEGSWGTAGRRRGDVAVTSLAGLAFMAGGNQPGRGAYSRQVTRAVEYILNQETPFFQGQRTPGFLYSVRSLVPHGPMYGHGFGTLFLAEVHGMVYGLDYLMRFCRPGANNNRFGFGRELELHFYYGHYYAVQAMWIKGGRYWREWFPAIRDELLRRRRPDGSWYDGRICPHYCTAMACIILQVPNNYLPIFQR